MNTNNGTNENGSIGIENRNECATNSTPAVVGKPKGWTAEKRARLGRKSDFPEISIVAFREGLSRSHVWSVRHGKRRSSFVEQKLAEVRAELAAAKEKAEGLKVEN